MKVGDRVKHKHDPMVGGTVVAVNLDDRFGWMVRVRWDDGYTFTYTDGRPLGAKED